MRKQEMKFQFWDINVSGYTETCYSDASDSGRAGYSVDSAGNQSNLSQLGSNTK